MATLPKSDPLSGKPDAARLSRPGAFAKTQAGRVPRVLSVSQAKTHLLAVLNEIETAHESVTITRRGRPVAQIVPIEGAKRPTGLGCMKGTVTILGDIVSPDHEAWGVQP